MDTMEMNPAWLTYPLRLEGTRDFECDPLTEEQCDYYTQHWHFWYVADWTFALPTVALFTSIITIFFLKHVTSFALSRGQYKRQPIIWRRITGLHRYLSYRGVHIKQLGWNSSPFGVLLLGFVGVCFFICMDLVPQPYYWLDEIFGDSPPLATRSGWLALACMPFIFATATKTNWITLFTGVSYERLQVFHRWIAYTFFVLALIHTFPFIVYHIHWQDMEKHFTSNILFYWTGIVAIILQSWLTFGSHSVIRNLGYEFFKITHFLAAALFVVVFLWHCDAILTSWHYFIAIAAIYVPCFMYPWLRTLFEYGVRQKATLTLEDGNFIRISIPAKFKWNPGQHCFLRFTSLGLQYAISAHPFTISSIPATRAGEINTLVFHIRRHTGLTAKLYAHASQTPSVPISVLVDGPYGGIATQTFNNANRALVIAGGSGAGWCLSLVEHYLVHNSMTDSESHFQQETVIVHNKEDEENQQPCRANTNTRMPSSLHVVLAIRDSAHQIWFKQTIDSLLDKYHKRHLAEVFVQTYLTSDDFHPAPTTSSPQSAITGSTTPTTSEQKAEEKGRPALPHIIHHQAALAAGLRESLAVYVCGPTTMQNDVRNAVAKENMSILMGRSKGEGVSLYSEHFDWA